MNELKKIRDRYAVITKSELNEDTNLWHQNGVTLEPLMSLTDGNIHGAHIADYIAQYRDPISIHCSECQGIAILSSPLLSSALIPLASPS